MASVDDKNRIDLYTSVLVGYGAEEGSRAAFMMPCGQPPAILGRIADESQTAIMAAGRTLKYEQNPEGRRVVGDGFTNLNKYGELGSIIGNVVVTDVSIHLAEQGGASLPGSSLSLDDDIAEVGTGLLLSLAFGPGTCAWGPTFIRAPLSFLMGRKTPIGEIAVRRDDQIIAHVEATRRRAYMRRVFLLTLTLHAVRVGGT